MAIEFTATGVVVRTAFRIDSDPDIQRLPDVAPALGGGYAVVWEDVGASESIQILVVNAVTPSDPDTEFTVADPVEPLDAPAIATFANGSYIVTYTNEHGTLGGNDIYFSIVNAAGTGHVRTDTALAVTDAAEDASAVATSNNIAAVVYAVEDVSPDVILKIVDSAGVVLDTKSVTGHAASRPDVARLADGRFLIVWTEFTTSADAFGRIYDPATLSFSGAAFAIVSGPGDQGVATVAGLPDGGFVATWTEVPAGANAGTVHARRFDATGAPAGDPFLLDTGTPGQAFTVVDANSAGAIFAVWNDFSGEATTDTQPPGLQGQFLQALTEPVVGTNGNDQIQATGLSEVINGLKGNDTVHAAGGDDIITGGRGRDLLFGEAGADRFDYNSLADSKLGAALRDVIKDFRHSEGDRIDLKTIDADTDASAGNQKFKFIGSAAFTGTDRELRFANGVVQGDTNGDGIAEFEIKVQTGGVVLVAGDFVL